MFRKSVIAASLVMAAFGAGSVQAQQAVPNNPPKQIVCVGSENLPGYGELTFHFFANGKASMMDKDGTSSGTWSMQGDVIRVVFGSIVYRGILQGNEIAGRATNGRDSWTWAVQVMPQGPPPVDEPAIPIEL